MELGGLHRISQSPSKQYKQRLATASGEFTCAVGNGGQSQEDELLCFLSDIKSQQTSLQRDRSINWSKLMEADEEHTYTQLQENDTQLQDQWKSFLKPRKEISSKNVRLNSSKSETSADPDSRVLASVKLMRSDHASITEDEMDLEELSLSSTTHDTSDAHSTDNAVVYKEEDSMSSSLDFKNNIYSIDELYESELCSQKEETVDESLQPNEEAVLRFKKEEADESTPSQIVNKKHQEIDLEERPALGKKIPPCLPSSSPVLKQQPAVAKPLFRFSARLDDDIQTPQVNNQSAYVNSDSGTSSAISTVHSYASLATGHSQGRQEDVSEDVEATRSNITQDYTTDFEESDSDVTESQQEPLQEPQQKSPYTVTTCVQTDPWLPTGYVPTEAQNLDPLEGMPADGSSSGAMTLDNAIRLQLLLTRQQIDNSKRLLANLNSSLTPNYQYTTLKSTKDFISKHKPKILTLEEAKKKVKL